MYNLRNCKGFEKLKIISGHFALELVLVYKFPSLIKEIIPVSLITYM